MPGRVINENEIFLDGARFKLASPIIPRLNNSYAEKISVGETTGDSQPRRSRVQWSDNRGGVGLDRITDLEVAQGKNLDRSFYSSAYLSHNGHLTLPRLATTTAASGASGVFEVGAIAELDSTIYAAFGKDVRAYNLATDSWGSSLDTLPALATDAITVRLGGTVYMIFAHTGGTTDTTNGSDFNDRTDDVLYMAFWDDRLWGIDNTGQLRHCETIGTWVDDAQLPLPNGFTSDLFVARSASGEHILYASTREGLYAHDTANRRFIKTDVTVPFHNDAGFGVTVWRGFTHYPAGLSIYQYLSAPQAALRVMGPDRDDGFPSNRRGTIVRLESSHNELLALVDSTSAAASVLDTFVADSLNDAQVIDPDAGVSLIAGWNGQGWQIHWESEANTEAITYSLVSNAYSGYRLWWAHNRRIHYMDLPVDILNPNETSDITYADSATHTFPWLMVGQETNGLALRLRVEVAKTSSTETVTPYYYTNFGTTATALTAISSDGITTYDFPDSTTPTGTAFRSIRIEHALARGDNILLSPDVIATTFEWRKKLPAQYSWEVNLDLDEAYGGLSPAEQRAALVATVASNPLVEWTYRADDGETRNYYVDVIGQGGLEYTGKNEKGKVTLLLAES